ncbi:MULTISPECIES: HopJ type III effector protein [Psychrobacter]|uniref:HopJ type III effector protein n=1 Tax=Psychrobacter TaxID=497 RepID=UPI00146C97B8|nr:MULTISPECIES: HopJ type III effector protein [Psychrobacter]
MSIRQSDVSALLNGISKRAIGFNDVIRFIDDFYYYTPVGFVNGLQHNLAGENEGSAKIFGFAKLHGLNKLDTLTLFGEHFEAVKRNPAGTDHANIRNFLHWGWEGLLMQKNPLVDRADWDAADHSSYFRKALKILAV